MGKENPRIQNPRIQNPALGIQNPKFGIQNSAFRPASPSEEGGGMGTSPRSRSLNSLLAVWVVFAGATAARAQEDRDLREIEALQKKLHACVAKVKPAYVFIGGGSGVCITADGWILTNHHVAGDNRSWPVRFAGGKQHTADVVGFDPHGDISVLKIRGGKDLPHCELGDSDALRVGHYVIAVGNPFLLGNDSWEPTITFGIVSALHRYMDNPGYFDAIQTDAQINPGNSGGPLIDLDGRVVGINGRIDIKRFMNRVNTGIGYAIPANQIRRYLPRFQAGGRVFEGYLHGVTIGECGDDRYENVGEYGDGVFAAALEEGCPADRAGMKLGDILFESEGYRIVNSNRFHGVMGNWPQGETIRIKVKRLNEKKEREVHELRVFLGDPEQIRMRDASTGKVETGFRPSFDFDDLGVEVDEVAADGPAAKAGLKSGDVVKKVDGRRVRNFDEFKETLAEKKPGDTIKLTVLRGEKETEIPLVLAAPK